MSTSIAYLRRRLERAERHDLLRAVDAGEISHYAAACAAGVTKRRPTLGYGNDHMTKRREWAIARAVGLEAPLPPLPEPQPEPAQPKVSKPRGERPTTEAAPSVSPVTKAPVVEQPETPEALARRLIA